VSIHANIVRASLCVACLGTGVDGRTERSGVPDSTPVPRHATLRLLDSSIDLKGNELVTLPSSRLPSKIGPFVEYVL